MSRERIVEIAETGVFRPRSRPWELHELHVPFDALSETEDYEQKAVNNLIQGTCVAVIGESGTGKSSVIAWLCSQLPDSHLALRIPITGVEDPGSVGEIARLALSIVLDGIAFDSRDERELEEARADSRTTTRLPVGFNAKLGGGAIPAEVGINAASLQEEFDQDRLEGEHLLALNGRLIPILEEGGITPVFVFEDTEATVGAEEGHESAEAFFAGPLSAFVDQVDAPTIVAVQTHLIDDSRAFGRLAPSLQRLTIPLLENRARAVVDSILARRLEPATLDDALASVFDQAGLDELADFYQSSGGDLRRVLAAVHEAAERASSDEAELIALPHVRVGVALWQ
jgi:hypothetical protein